MLLPGTGVGVANPLDSLDGSVTQEIPSVPHFLAAVSRPGARIAIDAPGVADLSGFEANPDPYNLQDSQLYLCLMLCPLSSLGHRR